MLKAPSTRAAIASTVASNYQTHRVPFAVWLFKVLIFFLMLEAYSRIVEKDNQIFAVHILCAFVSS